MKTNLTPRYIVEFSCGFQCVFVYDCTSAHVLYKMHISYVPGTYENFTCTFHRF